MNTKRNKIEYAGTITRALTLGSAALIALSGSVQAQTIVDGTRGVSMGGTAAAPAGSGTITGLSINTLPSVFNSPWTSQLFSGYVVPAGQFTGIALDGTNVAYANLLPIRGQSFSVADANDVTADVVQIDANGITTGGLSILDSTAVDGDSNPVSRAITVDNGQLMVGGTAVSAAGPTDTVNILDQTAVDSNDDPANQALTVDNGELLLNGNPVRGTVDPVAGLNNPATGTWDGRDYEVGRTEVTFRQWFQVLRWAVQATNGYNFGADNTTPRGDPAQSPMLSVDLTNTGSDANFIRVKFSDGRLLDNGGHSLGGFDHPVVGINYVDAIRWCNALSEMMGLTPAYYEDAEFTTVYRTESSAIHINYNANGWRLATGTEWWGLLVPGLPATSSESSNLPGTSASIVNLNSTAPVGSFPGGINDIGCYDVVGNVLEWTPDLNWQGTGRVTIGSAWNHVGTNAVSSFARSNNIGFRVLRRLPAAD